MKGQLHWVCASAIVAAIVTLAGCKSGEKSEASASGDDAVMCGKCETVWVRTEDHGLRAKGFTVYRTEKRMVCPDCESAMANFVKTGKLAHTCKTCGDALKHCKH